DDHGGYSTPLVSACLQCLWGVVARMLESATQRPGTEVGGSSPPRPTKTPVAEASRFRQNRLQSDGNRVVERRTLVPVRHRDGFRTTRVKRSARKAPSSARSCWMTSSQLSGGSPCSGCIVPSGRRGL